MEVLMLRRGFKAVCKSTEHRFQNFQIRVHRSLSWLERAMELGPEEHPDGRLLYAWIALNALYGQWDTNLGFPSRDSESRAEFVEMLFSVDHAGLLGEKVKSLEIDILAILENRFLDPRFWKDSDHPGNVKSKYFRAIHLFHDESWAAIVQHSLERIAVLRGQIAHGAATRGSRLNRDALRCCRNILETILPVALQIVIEHRADDNWPPLCYPPMDS